MRHLHTPRFYILIPNRIRKSLYSGSFHSFHDLHTQHVLVNLREKLSGTPERVKELSNREVLGILNGEQKNGYFLIQVNDFRILLQTSMHLYDFLILFGELPTIMKGDL